MELGFVDFFDARPGKMFGFLRVAASRERLWFHISDGRMPVINNLQKVELVTPSVPLPHPVTGMSLMFSRGKNAGGPKAAPWCLKTMFDERTEEAKVTPSRTHAGMFDLPVDGPAEERGCGRNSEAIGGFDGISWWGYFQDFETGVVYRVRCSDGVNGGNGPYTIVVEQLRDVHYRSLQRRFDHAEQAGATEIRISRRERFLMQGFAHAALLESARNRSDGGQSKEGTEGGLVGHYHGIPVICDLTIDEFAQDIV